MKIEIEFLSTSKPNWIRLTFWNDDVLTDINLTPVEFEILLSEMKAKSTQLYPKEE